LAKRKKNTAQKQAAQLELERDDLRERVTSENMRKAVLRKQNGYHREQIIYYGDELT